MFTFFKEFKSAFINGARDEIILNLSTNKFKVADSALWIETAKSCNTIKEVRAVFKAVVAEHKANGGGKIYPD
jgi:hypothetical protein